MKKDNKTFWMILLIISMILIILGITLCILKEKLEKEKQEAKNHCHEIFHKVILFDKNFSSKYPISDLNNLTSKERTTFLLNTTLNSESKEISFKKLTKEAPKYFQNTDLVTENIMSKDKKIIFYSYRNKKYTYENREQSDFITSSYDTDCDENKNEYILKQKLFYWTYTYDNQKYKGTLYKNYQDIIKKDPLTEFTNDVLALDSETYQKYVDEIPVYTYTFKLINNEYILKSVTIS